MNVLNATERAQFERDIGRYLQNRGGIKEDWSAIAGLGWFTIAFPEEVGGLGGGISDVAPLIDAVGRGLLSGPYLDSLVLAPELLSAFPGKLSEMQARIVDGALKASACDFTRSRVHCERAQGEEEQRLRGRARLFVEAAESDLLCLVASNVRAEECLLLIDGRSAGFDRVEYRLADGRKAMDLMFDGRAVKSLAHCDGPEASLLISNARHLRLLALAIESVGAISSLCEMTIEYAKTRRQFGVAIASFQVIQHGLANIALDVRRAAAFVRAASFMATRRSSNWRNAALAAKFLVDQAGRRIGEQALQIHGGIGMTEECQAGRLFKRVLTNEALEMCGADCLSLLSAQAHELGDVAPGLELDRVMERGND